MRTGVADHCLTAWLLRHVEHFIQFFMMTQMLQTIALPLGYCAIFNYNDSNGNRTRVTAVKGRCLNRLTMEPYPT